MGYKNEINNCTSCNNDTEPEKECSVLLDTSCVFYRWRDSDSTALTCLGLTAGTNLTDIIDEIDTKLCEMSGFNLSGFDLSCLAETHSIYSFKDFAEVVSQEICTLKAGDYNYKLDTLNANLQFINKPVLQDTCIGYTNNDSIQVILQKIIDKVCTIDSVKKQIVSSPNITVIDSKTVDITVCGEKDHTLKADVIVAPREDNKLKVLDSGLFVPNLTDVDIGLLLDRINSVPALKEKLCNICSFNQGVGGSSNARLCSCSMQIESIAKYNGNNYSVVINTVNLGISPFYWEVRNNLNIIVASGETTSETSILETFSLSNTLPEGIYTVRYTSLTCNCSDVKSFTHTPSTNITIAPRVISAVPQCTEDSNLILVSSVAGTNSEVTTIIRNATNQVIHTRTNSLNYNSYEITVNGIYTVTVYDADNNLVSSLPFIVNFTCIGDITPPEEICVTYNITSFSEEDPITINFINCDGSNGSVMIEPEDSLVICMVRGSFESDDFLTFTEIAQGCESVCDIEIITATIEY